MRELTEREILLQNLVATGASLLYRASIALGDQTPASQREAVVIEVETWFQESKQTIINLLAKPEIPYPQIPPPERKPDEVWKKPDHGSLAFFLD